jgi:hypothetical protein
VDAEMLVGRRDIEMLPVASRRLTVIFDAEHVSDAPPLGLASA